MRVVKGTQGRKVWLILVYEGKVTSSSLAYNRRETRDKRPLGRDQERSWCHLHRSVLPLRLWIHISVKVTPAPVRVPIQRPLVPSFTSVVG